jgi:hypothetical protein
MNTKVSGGELAYVDKENKVQQRKMIQYLFYTVPSVHRKRTRK